MSDRIKHAERLEVEAVKNQEWAESYRNTSEHATDKFSVLAEALRAGASALREIEESGKGFWGRATSRLQIRCNELTARAEATEKALGEAKAWLDTGAVYYPNSHRECQYCGRPSGIGSAHTAKCLATKIDALKGGKG